MLAVRRDTDRRKVPTFDPHSTLQRNKQVRRQLKADMASLRQRAEAKQKWLHGKEHRCLLDGGGITPDKVRGVFGEEPYI